jgi:hypothetical protein
MAINLYEMVDTWNDAAVTFTAIKMNVTDTASNAASLLMDLQVGGVSRFSVSKTSGNFSVDGGVVRFGNGTTVRGQFSHITGGTGFVMRGGTGNFATGALGVVGDNTIYINPNASFGFNNSTNMNSSTLDTILARDAADTLAQRRSTNAQTFRLYNTFTDASNFERGFMRWSSNVLEIGTEAGGTGSARSIRFNPSSKLLLPAGSVANANSLTTVFNGFETTGFGTNGSNLAFWLAANLEFNLSNNSFRVRRDSQFSFSSAVGNTSAPDTGLARSAAGVVKVTNGSTGTGELIFIVPTADPGITGALWNNAGTLSISA